jgi:tRNA(Ile)-lysidine synthase
MSTWSLLHDRIHRTIRQRQLLQKGQRLLMAVSGGQDSLCLARLLLDLTPKWNWQIAIAHCNHRWRSDATENASYVAQLADRWQVLYFERVAEEIVTSEAGARQWRYQALAKIAATEKYDAVLTGHTASDRAETLLYNLMRGSGADGLQSLVWQRELAPGIVLVRPLLEVSRQETAQFCENAQLQVWEDSTNHDWQYARNRIRQELLPYLQTHFNPQVEQALAQTAELLRADVAYLEAAACELRQQASAQTDTALTLLNSSHSLNRRVLQSAPLALQRRVMRQLLQERMPIAPTFDHVEKLAALITAPNRSRTDPFPGGAIAEVDGDWIWLRNQD